MLHFLLATAESMTGMLELGKRRECCAWIGQIYRRWNSRAAEQWVFELHLPSRICRCRSNRKPGLIRPPLPPLLRVEIDGKVDYGLRKMFPELEIETIIKWDQKVWEIAAASIIAKVHRDQYMIDLSQQERYSMYWFERHKGYGTRVHREAIQHYGLSDEHRKSFIHFI